MTPSEQRIVTAARATVGMWTGVVGRPAIDVMQELIDAVLADGLERQPPEPEPEPCACGHAWSRHGPVGTRQQGCWADGKAKGGICGCREGQPVGGVPVP